MTDPGVKEITPAGQIRFTVASRPQTRFGNSQTVSTLNGATSFQPIQLPASGWVRKLQLKFDAAMACASAGAVVAGDGPFNLVSGITVTDSQGTPVTSLITGYQLYLINKYVPSGGIKTNTPYAWQNPHLSPEFAFAATATTGTATFRLDLDFEQDYNSGYGCIPNVDSNASLQLRIDAAAYSVAFSGTTVSAATLSVRVTQHYWAPVDKELGGIPVQTKPVGAGDYLETRIETQTVSATTENTVAIVTRGGMVKTQIFVSRNAGVRTDYTAGSNVGMLLDNYPIDEGLQLAEFQDRMRRVYGYFGADLTTSYAPLTAGVMCGLDRGVLVQPYFALSGGRDSWLPARVGSLVQAKLTPGASATQLEILTQMMQVHDNAAFFAESALD